MRDKTRDELQDALPDLLHGRLSADEAATVERAVRADPDLMAELAMLRAVHAAHDHTPTVDVARILRSLPAPASQVVAPEVDQLALRREAKRPVISRRFARAAALLVVVGGGTMISVLSGRGAGPGTTTVATSPAAESLALAAAMQLGLGTSTDDLTVEQLRALEADIRALDGVPSADPDVTIDLLAGEGA